MDASEGERFLHKRSIDDLDTNDNDEHWLWSHVGRIKRSIDTVLGTSDVQSNLKNRLKRDIFDFWGSSPTTEAPTREAPNAETTTAFNLFNNFWGSSNDETTTTTTNAPEVEHAVGHQNEHHGNDEEDDINPEDDNANNDLEDTATWSDNTLDSKLSRFCKFQ